MKKILGLDIGVNSVGFALVEKHDSPEKSKIIKTGVRIVNEDPDFHGNFYQGNKASKNASRRTKRLVRRNNQRFKQRRDSLYRILRKNGMFPPDDLLLKTSELDLYRLRHRAVLERVSSEEIGRIFIHLNQKRGYKSNRKTVQEEEPEGEFLRNITQLGRLTSFRTIGQFWFAFLEYKNGRGENIDNELYEWFSEKLKEEPGFRIRENVFPRESYIAEFDRIWEIQQKYHPVLLTGNPGRAYRENKNTLYQLIRNEIIFYQRKLKSSKHLIGDCSFEKNHKAIPKSSPLFQFFRIWQQLNNLEVSSVNGLCYIPTLEQKKAVFRALHDPSMLTQKCTLAYNKILKVMGFSSRDYYLNYNLLEGNKTYHTIFLALEKAGVAMPDQYLRFNPLEVDEKGGLFQLWHIAYSLENDDDITRTIKKHFGFGHEQAEIFTQNVGFPADFGSLSSRAIRRLIPHMLEGKKYHEACEAVGYKNPEHISQNELKLFLSPVFPNSLRNPVVEQVLNQVVNVVNCVIERYGKPDEVRVELARELKNNARTRKKITQNNRNLRKLNDAIGLRIKSELGFTRLSALDIQRYRLWEETEKKCLYCGGNISVSELYNGETEIEHIIPWSRSFNDAMTNKIIAHRRCNRDKDQMTAFDFMASKGENELSRYTHMVDRLYNEGSGRLDSLKKIPIPGAKRENLLCKGEDIKGDFLARQLKDTQYIVKETVSRLREVFPVVNTTTGAVTDFLREKWELKHLLQEINLGKYREAGMVEWSEIKDNSNHTKKVEIIKDWTKRDDHRHHAADALIVALTSQGFIQKINTLNKDYEKYRQLKESPLNFPIPVKNLRAEARNSLEDIFVSFKKSGSKVLSRKLNKIHTPDGVVQQETWVPRGSLHEDTIMGIIYTYSKIPLDKKFKADKVNAIADEKIKCLTRDHLAKYDNDPKKAFNKSLVVNGKEIKEVTILESRFTKRVEISENITAAQIEKIIDPVTKKLIIERIKEKGSIKQAFRDYLHNPVWQNSEKGIMIRYVTVFDEGNLERVRDGYAYTKGNHHALIYEDENGNYTDRIVTFWEAVSIGLANLQEKGSIYPIIDRSDKPGLKFKISLQINDLVVFDLNPEEIDFFHPDNRALISRNLFRLQKMSSNFYVFRHHLESSLRNEESFATRNIRSAKGFKAITKLRLNHLGEIISIGE